MMVRFMTPTHFRVQAQLSMLRIATRPGSFCPGANRRRLIFGLEVGVRPRALNGEERCSSDFF